MKALIIDDDVGLCELVKQTLAKSGVETHAQHDGDAGIARLADGPFDVVILDVMLGASNGFEVLQRIRMVSDVPVIMLTARGDERDRIRGLELGADDYVPKPFSPDELLARMKAIIRRVNVLEAATDIQIEDVVFHPTRQRGRHCRRDHSAHRRRVSHSEALDGSRWRARFP